MHKNDRSVVIYMLGSRDVLDLPQNWNLPTCSKVVLDLESSRAIHTMGVTYISGTAKWNSNDFISSTIMNLL